MRTNFKGRALLDLTDNTKFGMNVMITVGWNNLDYATIRGEKQQLFQDDTEFMN